MFFFVHFSRLTSILFFILIQLLPFQVPAETKTWTGYGGDVNWSDPLNWSGSAIPQITDDVLLDNGDLPVSYQVILPDYAVRIKTIHIVPSPGRNIELLLPFSNTTEDAFSVTGPGYGIELNAGAVFRNASGLSSGESLLIADSMEIHDGGRYIHQTRSAHANSILKYLSTAPGTERGVFEFNVPKASYTISVSNRIYGSLELQATSYGAAVNYTCTGSNPLLIQGDLRIGNNVSMSIDLLGINGNIQVNGDFIQEGGLLNLASGASNNTILHIRGDLYQSANAMITESTSGFPSLELNGNKQQEIAMAGRITNQVGFRLNNLLGAELRLPLTVPFSMELKHGRMISTANSLLILDAGCEILADSSMLSENYIDGPMRKLGLSGTAFFLFPVGKKGNLRWLEMKNATGNFTVEYFRDDPVEIGSSIGPGLDHISKLEYWNVIADNTLGNSSRVELSFASAQSGGISDPEYLNVAGYASGQWQNEGHGGTTGNAIQGSVISSNTDFSASSFTLASTINLENPLPLIRLDLSIYTANERQYFNWVATGLDQVDHFEIEEEINGQLLPIASIPAVDFQSNYFWSRIYIPKTGAHFFKIKMIDVFNNAFTSNLVLFKDEGKQLTIKWLLSENQVSAGRIQIHALRPEIIKYEIISVTGTRVKTGEFKVEEGDFYPILGLDNLSAGLYIFIAVDQSGNIYRLQFLKK